MPNKVALLILLSAVSISVCQIDSVSAKAKQWTITERQQALSSKVDKGEKSNELTKKEADKLRSRLSDVDDKIQKAKDKNGGKLSYKDEGKIEKILNSISVDLDKEELDKRVQSR
jgi:hypothetical protein